MDFIKKMYNALTYNLIKGNERLFGMTEVCALPSAL